MRGEKQKKRRWARLLTRAGVLVTFVLIVVLWPVGVAWLIPLLSPHVAAGSAVVRKTLLVTSLCGVPGWLVVMWRRRWLCRWVCPTGLVLEGSAKLLRGRPRGYPGVPALGQWAVLATLGGAIMGLPLFLWLDPMAIFSGAFEALHRPVTLASTAPALGLMVLVVLNVIWPGLWCRKLCPLGGLQDCLGEVGSLARVTQADEKADAGAKRLKRLGRRVFLCAAGGGAVGLGIRTLLRDPAEAPLRPPGAVGPIQLAGQCIRCGNCVRVCPSGIIRQSLRVDQFHLLLTPMIDFDGDYCREDCHACTQSCPSGAIDRLTLDEKNDWRIGLARIDLTACILVQETGECGHCLKACPTGAITSCFDEDAWKWRLAVDAAKCNGCGACLVICPAKVISIMPPVA